MIPDLKNRPMSLALAIQSGQTSKVKLLIDNGADVNAPLDLTSLNQDPFFSMMNMGMMGQRNANLTPLALATRSNRTEIVKLLIENGAKVNVHNDRGLNPLREACKRGYVDIAKLLIDVILSKNLNEKKPDFVEQANQELSDYWDKPIKINYLRENRIIGSKNSTEKILASHLPFKKDSLLALSFSQFFKSLNAEAIQDKVANGTNQSVLNTTLPHKLS